MAPTLVCRKRPFTIHADRLRPRLKGGRLGGPYFGTLKIAIRVFPVTSLQPVCPLLWPGQEDIEALFETASGVLVSR